MYKNSKKVYYRSVNSNTGKVELGKVISDEILTSFQKLTSTIGNVEIVLMN